MLVVLFLWPSTRKLWLHSGKHYLATLFTFHKTCAAGKTVKVVGGKPAHDQSREEGGLGENVQDEEVEEYLQTANWQLGNRRVRCCLMLDTRRGGKRGKRKTHIYRECTVTYFASPVFHLCRTVTASCFCLALIFQPMAEPQLGQH